MARPKKIVDPVPDDGVEHVFLHPIEELKNLESDPEDFKGVKPIREVELKPVEDAPVSLKEMLIGVFANRVKTNVPTLVEYKLKGSLVKKYVILDLDADAIREAWEKYCTMRDVPESEEFLLAVYDVTSHDIPRMYRNVIPVSLI